MKNIKIQNDKVSKIINAPIGVNVEIRYFNHQEVDYLLSMLKQAVDLIFTHYENSKYDLDRAEKLRSVQENTCKIIIAEFDEFLTNKNK